MVFFVPLIFQSTRPVRGATQMASAIQETEPISIHAPRAGRDVICVSSVLCFLLFQSTRPVRGATEPENKRFHVIHISIHAPRAGRDPKA